MFTMQSKMLQKIQTNIYFKTFDRYSTHRHCNLYISNLVDCTQKHDAVLVDKDFLIDDLCSKKKIMVIRPPYFKDQKQFSKEDVLLSKDIAKVGFI